ncbi:MAG: D-erythronate dehydrogenase [Pseudomonadota bacterium]
MSGTLILGGGGMVGQRLAHALAADGATDVTLADIGFPPDGAPASARITGSVTDAALIRRLVAARPDPIFHLAAIVSGEAEAEYLKGWDINAHAFWTFLEAVRTEHEGSGGAYRPRIVFTSSIAVFGPPFPDKIPDDFLTAPATSYGAQKASCELLLTDASRKGFVDGIAIRLPTICVRPGKPNKAASGFFSGIIREPLNGQEAILPVDPSVRHWHASPRSAVHFLKHAALLGLDDLGTRRALTMPGLSCTVEEQIEALRAEAGSDAVALIRSEPDETIRRIVAGWPRDFAPARAIALGFRAEADFREIVQIHIADTKTNQ